MKDRKSISCQTQLCAVVGKPIGHSLSPALHNAALTAAGLDFVYLAFEVDDVKSFLQGMRAMNRFRGLSITIPHKIEAMKYVDEVAAVDRSIGSINTIVHEGDKLRGLSTDGPGALKAIADAGVDLTAKNVVMLGAGGAARAVSFNLARNARLQELRILDIDEKVLGGLATDLKKGTEANIQARPSNERSLAEAMQIADLIIHCTPIGMHPKEDVSLVPPELFRPGQVVFDIVYTPLETKLLREAKTRGLQIIHGVDMFVNQAALQFEQFTGAEAPVAVMREVVMQHLKS